MEFTWKDKINFAKNFVKNKWHEKISKKEFDCIFESEMEGTEFEFDKSFVEEINE